MPGKPAEDLTDDAALGGRLHLLQPRRGHRFGHDAILLAAATPARSGDRVADLGAGVGAAGLALASRVPGARVTLVEIDARLAALAQENASRNGFAASVDAVTLDVAAAAADFAAAGLAAASCDIVLMNPPFHDKRSAGLPRSAPPRRPFAGGREPRRLGGGGRTAVAAGRYPDADLPRRRPAHAARPARRGGSAPSRSCRCIPSPAPPRSACFSPQSRRAAARLRYCRAWSWRKPTARLPRKPRRCCVTAPRWRSSSADRDRTVSRRSPASPRRLRRFGAKTAVEKA